MKGYGTIDYISGLNEASGRYYVLRKSTTGRDELIVIQAPAVVPEDNMPVEKAMKWFPEWDRSFDHGLEIIQTLLPTLQFGRTSWAYLVRRNNAHRIIYKENPLPAATEIIPWCPLVDERDIEITGWLYAEDRHGIWNGIDVDLFMAWDSTYVGLLEKSMAAHRLLVEYNLEHLVYPAVGHVVRRGTNNICGLMTAAAHGRMVEYTDKSAVYKAIAEIQRAGLMFMGIKLSNIMLTHDGKVRLLSLCALVRQPADLAKRASDLAYWHWEQLETLFEELKAAPNPFTTRRKLRRTPLTLPPFPAPVRGPSWMLWLVLIPHPAPDPCRDAHAEEDDDEGKRSGAVACARPRSNDKGSVELLVLDAPVSARSLRDSRPRLLARATIPYLKPDKLLQELLRVQSWQQRKTSNDVHNTYCPVSPSSRTDAQRRS
ncbi:hypothetical protein DFH07DRAFT_849203 [Mycena maculata]|uniref:Uncharacterized protein n=1 Tax=Mycena maculata TaxID=230809 RepID=A0AAD7MSN6_9AGAR|nr:hypothetical protein DFH07DRAFT_849203 [Mycena maculata]